IGRIVLAVAVEGGDPGRARRLYTGAQRRALATAMQVLQYPQLGRTRPGRAQFLGGAVIAAVVDDHDLEGTTAAQRDRDLIYQGTDVALLVTGRDDDGKFGWIHGSQRPFGSTNKTRFLRRGH